jgi:hypothetical protein
MAFLGYPSELTDNSLDYFWQLHSRPEQFLPKSSSEHTLRSLAFDQQSLSPYGNGIVEPNRTIQLHHDQTLRKKTLTGNCYHSFDNPFRMHLIHQQLSQRILF